MYLSSLRIWAVLHKEFIQTLRDRRTLLIQLGLPIIQLFILGYAIRMNVEHVPTVVADQSLDSASRDYVDAMVVSGFFDVVAYLPSEAEVIRAIDRGQAQAGIVIPPAFAAQVARGSAQTLLLVDGSDVFTSQTAYNAITAIARQHSTQVLVERLERAGGLLGEKASADGTSGILPLDARMRILYNPNLDDLWFLVPSMTAMILQTQAIALTAAAVVRERETGTIEQLLVTPIRPGELLLGKIAPNLVIALVNMLTIVAIGFFWFHVPFQGSFWLFFWLAFMYVFSGLGLGLLLSSISNNQAQAQQWSMLFMLLGLVLGGFIFPRYLMPLPIRILGNLFPLTYFIPIARGIITKGIGIQHFWEQVVALLVYVVLIAIFATRSFRQHLD
jgi:ABC-2 type transport system permease protein